MPSRACTLRSHEAIIIIIGGGCGGGGINAVIIASVRRCVCGACCTLRNLIAGLPSKRQTIRQARAQNHRSRLRGCLAKRMFVHYATHADRMHHNIISAVHSLRSSEQRENRNKLRTAHKLSAHAKEPFQVQSDRSFRCGFDY